MIYFNKIRYKNLISSGAAFTEFNFREHKSTLILGKNGAGKSTLLDALCFVLYNKPYRDINKPQLVNSINKKEMLVEIEFEIGSNEYLVRRGMKPDIFEIYLNGTKLPQDASNLDYQDYFEKFILRMNYKTFCQIAILGTAKFTAFMELAAKERREVVEDILDLQVFTTMNSVLKSKLDKNKDLTKDIDTEIKIVKEKIDMQEKYIQSIQKNTDELIEEAENKILEYTRNINIETSKILEYDNRIQEISADANSPEKYANRLAKLKGLKSQLEQKLNKIDKDIDFYHSNDTCPTCKQGIDHDFKAERITTREQDIQETNLALNKINEEIKTTQSELDKANQIFSECSDLNIKKNGCMVTIRSYERTISEAKKALEKLNERKVKIQNFDEDAIEANLPDLLVTHENTKAELVREKEVMTAVSVFLKDTGVKSKIINKYVPIINKFLNKYLEALDFPITMEMDSTFKEELKSRHRDKFSFYSFSEGEKSRINLAILFTWREITKMRNSAATNLLIFDEVFDGSLDPEGIDKFLKITSDMLKGTSLIVISHKSEAMVDKFERTIRFSKQKNFSVMEDI